MVLAGDVESVLRNVTSVKEGDRVAPRPANLSYDEAAALPYGGLPAIHCLRKARLQPVTGVCSTANLELVESLAADAVHHYTPEDFTRRGERYDLIFDAVGKRKSAAAMRDAGRALTPDGTRISIDDDFPRLTRQDLELLKRLAESGALKPVIDRRYRLEEIVEAHRHVELGHKKGNVIVTVGPSAGGARSLSPVPSSGR